MNIGTLIADIIIWAIKIAEATLLISGWIMIHDLWKKYKDK